MCCRIPEEVVAGEDEVGLVALLQHPLLLATLEPLRAAAVPLVTHADGTHSLGAGLVIRMRLEVSFHLVGVGRGIVALGALSIGHRWFSSSLWTFERPSNIPDFCLFVKSRYLQIHKNINKSLYFTKNSPFWTSPLANGFDFFLSDQCSFCTGNGCVNLSSKHSHTSHLLSCVQRLRVNNRTRFFKILNGSLKL